MPAQAISHALAPASGSPLCEPLRFGFTADDVDHLARAAMRRDTTTLGLDASDRLEAAWFAIVDQLYSTDEPLSANDLLSAARNGLRALYRDDIHTRGFNERAGKSAGQATAPGFVRYWSRPALSSHTDPMFVTTVTDRLALGQIFTMLTSAQREALLALAMHQDYTKAADALSLTKSSFYDRIKAARQTFLGLWHERETPRPPWRKDQRVERLTLPRRVAAVLTAAELPDVVLPHARQVFDHLAVDRLHSRDLLAHLVQAHPALYGTWDQCDLSAALRACGVPPPRQIEIAGVPAKGYRLDGIERAAEDVRDNAEPVPDECDMILARWLYQEQEQQRQETAARHTCDDMLTLIAAAGPDGIRPATLKQSLSVRPETVQRWLAAELETGSITRLGNGRYAPSGRPSVRTRTRDRRTRRTPTGRGAASVRTPIH